MKKIYIHLIILYMATLFAHSQESGSWIIPNPDYQKYIELERAGKWNPPGTAKFTLGYKPGPYTVRHNPTPAIVRNLKSSLEEMPAGYDLRDAGMVTDVKDQGGGVGGNCTSFATMGSLESRWLKMGLATFDLAEQNLPACHGFDEEEWGYDKGANQFICTSYLTRFSGPVLESQDPYNREEFPCKIFDPVAYVPEARWLPGRDFQQLKQSIYYYGGVMVDIHWETNSFNADDNTYYYNGIIPANHALLAVGWDDTKVTEGGTGAWIVKNSWSSSWAEDGFAYVSYNDTKFGGEMAYWPVRWDSAEVDSLYMYDWLGMVKALPIGSSNVIHELVKFDAPGAQLLTRVGIQSVDPNTVFDIEVYEDFSGGELSNLIASRSGNVAKTAGFFTFEIPALVSGDFYVKVKRTVDADIAWIPVEAPDEGFADPVIEEDVNWISTDGKIWDSTNPSDDHDGYNLNIRAYTSFDTRPRALFHVDHKKVCLNGDVTFTFQGNHPVNSWEWDFGEGASPATANTEGPHTVSYSTEGVKSISLKVTGAGGEDDIVRQDYIQVIGVDEFEVFIPTSEIRVPLGDSIEISAYGANEWIWVPTAWISGSGQTVYANPPEEGSYELTAFGTQGDCSGQDKITIISAIPPVNDDMCDALLLSNGGWMGQFSNINGTAQPEEPMPDTTSCYTDTTWCNEQGIQASVWFYFMGPSTGLASIRTDGFDNQIAIYRADDCEDIIKENLVAANDDISSGELSARVDFEVTPGARYYLQVDGSGQTKEGVFSLWYYAHPVGTEDLAGTGDASLLHIYPNPATGIYNITMSDVGSGQIGMKVYNLNGQMMLEKSFRSKDRAFVTQLDLTSLSDGIYYLRLTDGNRVLNRKLIKQ